MQQINIKLIPHNHEIANPVSPAASLLKPTNDKMAPIMIIAPATEITFEVPGPALTVSAICEIELILFNVLFLTIMLYL